MPFDLVLGGVRSGKSRLAVQWAMNVPGNVSVVVTAAEIDDEMTRRIAAHRLERPTGWVTVEEPCDLRGALDRIPDHEAVVLDCVTVWTANLMFADVSDDEVISSAAAVASRLAERPGPAMVVSNEVGMGVHPYTELGRHYRDLLGAVNVRFSAAAERAGLVVAGRVLALVPAGEWLG